MIPIAACPSPDRLIQFINGQLPEAEAESLIGHLENCPNCLDAVRLVNDSADTSDLRAAATITETGGESPIIQKLISKVLEARDKTGAATDSVSSPEAPTIVPLAAEDDSGELSFLAPAQGPGEIGRLNGYRVLQVLGAGGMGLVLEAEDMRLKRRVALKVMKPAIATKNQNRLRFVREAEAAARIEHEHIVPIFQIGEENGVPFIVMPFLKGEPLDSRLKRGRMEMPEIIQIGQQIAEGLAAAHAHRLVHRDIKPGNIWLEEIRAKESGTPPTVFGTPFAPVKTSVQYCAPSPFCG